MMTFFCGIGIIVVEDEQAAQRFMENDPAIRSGMGLRYEIFPMPREVEHPEFARELRDPSLRSG